MIDTWVDAFAGSGIDLSFEGTNYYYDKGDRQRMNDYAASQGLGVQHAKWHPDWEDMAVACASCWSRGKGMVDPPLRWENQVMFARRRCQKSNSTTRADYSPLRRGTSQSSR